MNIILLNDVDKVGYKFDVVTVKDGFARNYLIPQGLALIANDTNNRRLADYRRREDAAEAKKLGVYQAIATKVKDKTLKIGAKAGTSGKIFGSVTNVQIIAALKDQLGVDIERRKVELPNDVKNLGTYTAILKLHKEVEAAVNFEVVSE